MGIIIVKEKVTAKDIEKAREHYPNYIKVTADIKRKIVLIGGEYHADAERMLLEEHGSRQSDIWDGGYNLETGDFEVNAMINLRPKQNSSYDILDPETRDESPRSKLREIFSVRCFAHELEPYIPAASCGSYGIG
jgi:hypothetical protein